MLAIWQNGPIRQSGEGLKDGWMGAGRVANNRSRNAGYPD